MIYIFKHLLLSWKKTNIVGHATNDGLEQWFQRDGVNESDSGYILKVEPTEFATGLETGIQLGEYICIVTYRSQSIFTYIISLHSNKKLGKVTLNQDPNCSSCQKWFQWVFRL